MKRLEIWNPWWKTGKISKESTGLERQILKDILPFAEDTKFIKAIIGPRRAGKTTLLYQILERIAKKQGVHSVFYVNFEDPLLKTIRLDEIINSYISEQKPEKAFIFLDEVQLCANWEQWLRTYVDTNENLSFFVSGSTSSTLGNAFYKALAGRAFVYTLYPFNYRELLSSKGISIVSKQRERAIAEGLIEDYMRFGSFPAVSLESNENKKSLLLTSYFNTIISRDISAQHNLDNNLTTQIVRYLYRNSSSLTSLNKLRKIFNISYEKMDKYYSSIIDSFAIIESLVYDTSLKRQKAHPRKIYSVDLGLRWVVAQGSSEDSGKLLETIVAQELTKNNMEFTYGKEEYECDFIITKEGKPRYAIQVCWELNPDNEIRELNGLNEVKKIHKIDGEIVTRENIVDFLVKVGSRKFREGLKMNI